MYNIEEWQYWILFWWCCWWCIKWSCWLVQEPYEPSSLLIQFSATEQEENKCKSMIRLRDTKTANYMKRRISDFFSVEQWPLYIVRIFLGTEDFVYPNRLAFAAFFHGNGYKNTAEIELVFKFYNKNWNHAKQWDVRFRHFRTIFDYLERANKPIDDSDYLIQTTYNYFNMTTGPTMSWIEYNS